MTKPWTEAAIRLSVDTRSGALPVIVAQPDSTCKGTVLLLHGRNGAPGQPQIAEIATAYLARGWRVAAPELPNSSASPQSGPPDQVTFAGHVDAAMQVWAWVAQQWPHAPRALAGHSIGGFATAHLAAATPDTHHVLAVSAPMSGQVLLRARQAMGQGAVDEVRLQAPAYFIEMLTADAEPALNRVSAPLAVVTGAEDGLVPLRDARAYFMAAPNGRFFAALPCEHHCPAGEPCANMLAAALAAVGA